MDKVYSMMGVDVGDTYEEEYYDDYAQGGYDEPDPNESYMPSRRNSGRNAGRVTIRGQPSDETCYYAACKL